MSPGYKHVAPPGLKSSSARLSGWVTQSLRINGLVSGYVVIPFLRLHSLFHQSRIYKHVAPLGLKAFLSLFGFSGLFFFSPVNRGRDAPPTEEFVHVSRFTFHMSPRWG